MTQEGFKHLKKPSGLDSSPEQGLEDARKVAVARLAELEEKNRKGNLEYFEQVDLVNLRKN